MSLVLPGELVPAQHVNLKLGPGLLQQPSPSGESSIITTRAGELNHSPNGARWWIESNARRVSENFARCRCYWALANGREGSMYLHRKSR